MIQPYLTKSRYMAGLQCARHLWLSVHEPFEFEAPDPGLTLDFGRAIGERARLLFPSGVLVLEPAWDHAKAVARTAALMADVAVPAIFEAAFTYQNVRIRVDILTRTPRGWDMIEVKASTQVKDHYLDDMALQAFVLAGSNVKVRSYTLMHVNNQYVRGSGEIDWREYFTRAAVTAEVKLRLPSLPAQIPAMLTTLAATAKPHADAGAQCSKPYSCAYWDQCTADKPADWIFYLPRLSDTKAKALDALGITAVSQIPSDFALTNSQAIMRDVLASGQPYVAPDLPRLLHRFGPPACYLDFEAMSPPIPLYEGTRPYQALPFQWSLHILDGAGQITHQEFLADGQSDPRRAFAQSLVAALKNINLPIVVYSSYEQSRLKELVLAFPDLAKGLAKIIANLADLLPVVRGAVYHGDFNFSHSIKKVGPALCPDFTYDDLEGITDGQAAASAFAEMAAGFITDAAAVKNLRKSLLAYCKRDTLAMVEVHKALIMLSGPVKMIAKSKRKLN